MPRKVSIPRSLQGQAIRSSDAGDHGLSAKRLRGRDVAHPFHGVSTFEFEQVSILDRCRAYEPLLRPGHAFSHLTAATLWGAPAPPSDVLHVSAIGTRSRPRTGGVSGHELPGSTAVVFHLGLPVVAPGEAWAEIAGMVTREELVAAGDFLVSGTRLARGERTLPLCSLAALDDVVEHHALNRGAAKLRWALPRLRTGVDSPTESLLRLIIVASRFPEPVVGLAIPVAGGVVLHPDLCWPELRLVLEYEGDEHRTSVRRFRDDILRRELLEAAGYRVIRVTWDDLTVGKRQFVERVRASYRRRSAEIAASRHYSP